MKPTAILINTARGEIADEEAIARALTEGWIAGAALDAFTREPLPAASPLRDGGSRAADPHAPQRRATARRAAAPTSRSRSTRSWPRAAARRPPTA